MAAQILSRLMADETELPFRPAPKEPDPASDHWTRPILLERAAYLAKMARFGQGTATETVREYPQYAALLSFWNRDSDVEIDADHARLFIALDGRATLVIGGTLPGTTQTSPCNLEGGVRYSLRAGDIVHIPAGRQYQVLVAGENTLSCLILRVREIP